MEEWEFLESPSYEDTALLAGMPKPFLSWYRANARDLPWRRDREPYHVWLSEVMLQQTRVEAAKGYYLRFLEALPDIRSLASATEEAVFKLWEGLGYYRRARNLRQAAQVIVRDFGGEFPASFEEILALPGIGAYTAGAVASICFNLPKPAVDGNVLRVLSRILDSDESIDRPAFKKRIGAALEEVMRVAAAAAGAAVAVDSAFSAGKFNQSLMEIGAVLCLPKGALRCGVCPAEPFCKACRSGRAELLPVRNIKKARRIEERTVFLFMKPADGSSGDEESMLALCRREGEGLLAGMWELPNTDGWLSPDEAVAMAVAWGIKPVSLERSMERVHVFSHIEWHMRGYVINAECEGSGVPPAVCAASEECAASVGSAPSAERAASEERTASAGSGAPPAERAASVSSALPAERAASVESAPPEERAVSVSSAPPAGCATSVESAPAVHRARGRPPTLIWTTSEEREKAYPLPAAFSLFIK